MTITLGELPKIVIEDSYNPTGKAMIETLNDGCSAISFQEQLNSLRQATDET